MLFSEKLWKQEAIQFYSSGSLRTEDTNYLAH